MKAIPLSYSYRNLWTRKLTTVLTLAGIALVVFVFAAVLMMAHGLKETMVATGGEDNFVVIRKSANSDVLSTIGREDCDIIETFPEVALGNDGKPIVSKETVTIINMYKFGSNDMSNVIVRGILRERVIGLLVRAGLPRGRLDALAAWLAGRGARGVAVARLTPGIRVGAIAASGLAGLRSSAFIPGLVVGNGAFVGGHFLLGLAVGRPALELLDRLGARASAAIAAVAILAVAAAAGALAWRLLARRRAGLAAGATGGFAAVEGRGSGAAGTGRSAFEAWADAACPACVALAFRIGDERVMAIPAPVEARR